MNKLLVGAIAALIAASPAASAQSEVTYRDPAWSPNGRQIAFVSNRDNPARQVQIYVMNLDGSGVRRLTNDDLGKTGTAWSTNGKEIGYQGYAYIYAVGVNGAAPRRLTGYGGYMPEWSPHGRKIAFARGDDTSGGSIFVMNPDGSHKTLVAAPRGSQSLGSPTWSPDGQRLAFSIGTAPDANIVTPGLAIISQYRGRWTRLATGHAIYSADWSPDGRHILLVEDPKVNNPRPNIRISVLDLRTRKIHWLGRRATYTAHWSPNGRKIVFSYYNAIYVMNADGSHLRKLLPT